MLDPYRVKARNTSAESENKIHDDSVAKQYGFDAGLVPGITTYGHMTVPIVNHFGAEWLEQGAFQVKFHKPFYEGDDVTVRAEVDDDSAPAKISVFAEKDDGMICATGLATVNDRSTWLGDPAIENYPEADLPAFGERPLASKESVIKLEMLGTLRERVDIARLAKTVVADLSDPLDIYTGSGAPAHPAYLLGLANRILVENFKLGPWIHTASDLINWSAAHDSEELSVHGRIIDCFERKGHELAVLDLLIVAGGKRAVQQIRHTAIYRLRPSERSDEVKK